MSTTNPLPARDQGNPSRHLRRTFDRWWPRPGVPAALLGLVLCSTATAGNDHLLVANDDRGTIEVWSYPSRELLARGTPFGQVGDFDKSDDFAVGDVIGDDKQEVIIAEDSNGIVEVFDWTFDGAGNIEFRAVLNFKPAGEGGAYDKNDRLAVGDVLGDGKAEILIGEDSNGWIDAYRAGNPVALRSFRPKGRGGMFDKNDALAAGNVHGNSKAEVLIGEDSSHYIDIFAFGSNEALGSIRPELSAEGFDKHDALVVGRFRSGGQQIVIVEDNGDRMDILSATSLTRMDSRFDVVGSGTSPMFDHGDKMVAGLPSLGRTPGPQPKSTPTQTRPPLRRPPTTRPPTEPAPPDESTFDVRVASVSTAAQLWAGRSTRLRAVLAATSDLPSRAEIEYQIRLIPDGNPWKAWILGQGSRNRLGRMSSLVNIPADLEPGRYQIGVLLFGKPDENSENDTGWSSAFEVSRFDVSARQLRATRVAAPGARIKVFADVVSDGTPPDSPYGMLFLSEDTVVDAADRMIFEYPDFAPGRHADLVTLPADVMPGRYSLILQVHSDDADPSNNEAQTRILIREPAPASDPATTEEAETVETTETAEELIEEGEECTESEVAEEPVASEPGVSAPAASAAATSSRDASDEIEERHGDRVKKSEKGKKNKNKKKGKGKKGKKPSRKESVTSDVKERAEAKLENLEALGGRVASDLTSLLLDGGGEAITRFERVRTKNKKKFVMDVHLDPDRLKSGLAIKGILFRKGKVRGESELVMIEADATTVQLKIKADRKVKADEVRFVLLDVSDPTNVLQSRTFPLK